MFLRSLLLAVISILPLSFMEAAPPRSVLVLGDSLAAGYGLDREEAFPAILQTKAEKENLPVKVINGGVSGDTSAGGVRRVDWLLNQKIDVLVLALGANDGLRGITPETTHANLQAIIDRAKKKYPEIKIVVAGMRMPPNFGPDYTAKFEKIFPDLAAKNDAKLVPFLLQGVGGDTKLNQRDRIHPTAEGQKILAENVWRILRPLLL